MIEGPKLLVEWSSPWYEFRTAIRPAFARSEAALAGETPTGLFPLRGILVSWGAEAIVLALAIILPTKLATLAAFRATTPPKHEVIYYYGPELPQVEDFGGAQSGRTGRAGGQQAFHKTQTIRVARGNSVSNKVVDAPNLKLPVTTEPVANLLAVKPIPGPPPAEGLKPSLTPPTLSKDAIVAPPPQVFRELNRSTPGLDSRVVAPPPASVARNRQLMGMSTTVILPAPNDIPRDQSRSVVAINSPIVQPAPDVPRDPPPLRGPTAATAIVVPPPVSAPQSELSRAAKLSLPAPAVVAPPPFQVTSDRTVSGASLSDPKVVPPPVQLGGRSQDKHAMVGMTGANAIVPPPPSVAGGSSISGGGRGNRQKPGGFGTVLSPDNVVPPPPSVSSDGTPSGRGRGDAHGTLGGGLGTSQIVPPPPSLTAGGDPLSGRGSGRKGAGFGGALDAGSVLAPPSPAGGSGGGNGIVVSNQPGSSVGIPGNGTAGSLAMSPNGGAKPGLGGSGGGTGIGRGDGPGSGLTGAGSGAAKAGAGHGSDPNSHGGNSPFPGLGGAGSGTNGRPLAPGVSIAGGNPAAIINLPSFGSDGNDPSVPGRSPTGKGRRQFDYTIEGSSRSGGGFKLYGFLRGDKVYTKYIPTAAGTAVMQFADASSATRLYNQDLTSPEPLVSNLAVKLNRSYIVIACVLDRSGALRDCKNVQADPGAPITKVVAALHTWKFTPAFRGNDPVEVNVLLGFNIDTR